VTATLPFALVTTALARGRELDMFEEAAELLVELEQMG
jgi:hypothetical protein